jgi:hypothetical protein
MIPEPSRLVFWGDESNPLIETLPVVSLVIGGGFWRLAVVDVDETGRIIPTPSTLREVNELSSTPAANNEGEVDPPPNHDVNNGDELPR